MGFTVRTAATVAAAREQLAQEWPDLALLDFNLPDGTALDLAETAHQQRPNFPLILLTGTPLTPEQRHELAPRFRSILSKPMHLAELRQAIDGILQAAPMPATLTALDFVERTPARPVSLNTMHYGSNAMIQILKIAAGVLIGISVLAAFGFFFLGIPLPWKPSEAGAASQPPPARELKRIEIVKEQPNTLMLPAEVRRSLGILRGGKDMLAVAKVPTQARPLVLPGSTALDPSRINRIRARFAPAEVVEIKKTTVPLNPAISTNKTIDRELRPGDEVKANQDLATFYSADVGNKKSDLFEAIVQLRLDQIILDQAEKGGSALPMVFVLTARRNVDTDRSAVRRAKNTLKIWGIPDEDIAAIEKEANDANLKDGKREAKEDADWNKNHDYWGRVVLKAPDSAVIVERNVSKSEIVVDNTINLFTLAKTDQLIVRANCPEDDLPEFYRLKPEQMRWTIQTVGANPVKGIEGSIDEIGWFIDQNQHTALITGYINNPGGKIRAGQFISATVHLPPPEDVVEIPIDALVEDGKQSIVFVQTDAAKEYYTMRRVVVTNRFEKTAFVSSLSIADDQQLTADEMEQGLLLRQPLKANEKVLLTGVLELKAALEEQKAKSEREQDTKK